MNHSPLPWTLHRMTRNARLKAVEFYFIDASGVPVQFDTGKSNHAEEHARKVLHAVNHHDKLREALQAMINGQMGMRIYDDRGAQSVSTDTNHPTLRLARAALKESEAR